MPVELKEHDNGRLLEVHLTGKVDYARLLPAVDCLLKQHGRIRMLVELHDFHGWTAGARWEDIVVACHHFKGVERLAIIGEAKWEQGMATFCQPFTKAEARFFDHTKPSEARDWVNER